MGEISRIKLSDSGEVYDLKDEYMRRAIRIVLGLEDYQENEDNLS